MQIKKVPTCAPLNPKYVDSWQAAQWHCGFFLKTPTGKQRNRRPIISGSRRSACSGLPPSNLACCQAACALPPASVCLLTSTSQLPPVWWSASHCSNQISLQLRSWVSAVYIRCVPSCCRVGQGGFKYNQQSLPLARSSQTENAAKVWSYFIKNNRHSETSASDLHSFIWRTGGRSSDRWKSPTVPYSSHDLL